MKSGDIVVYKDQIGKIVSDYENKEILRFLPCNYGSYSSSALDIITELAVREATHEEKLKLLTEEYPWGTVKTIHFIGEYQIVEATREGKTHWHGYINYKDTNTSYSSLDSAIVGCIGIKYEGGNGKAAMYFCKMVNMN